LPSGLKRSEDVGEGVVACDNGVFGFGGRGGEGMVENAPVGNIVLNNF
jgi:hypothetical protein